MSHDPATTDTLGGCVPAESRAPTAPTGPDRVDAVIIGAGFSGLYMLHQLRDQMGMTAQVIEAGGGVGGTWYWNRYPGARSDSDSYIYCYSFDRDLWQEWEWSERYPEQHEILAYLEHVAKRFDLYRDIEFGTRVTAATFDEATSRWTVTTTPAVRSPRSSSSPRSGRCRSSRSSPNKRPTVLRSIT